MLHAFNQLLISLRSDSSEASDKEIDLIDRIVCPSCFISGWK